MKDNVYIPPIAVDLHELCDRIVNAIALVDFPFLKKLLDQLEYLRFQVLTAASMKVRVF
jgi:hypothetical protein